MLIRNEISLKYIVSFNLTFDDPELNKNIDISVGDVVRIAYADMKNRINKRIEGKVSEIKTDRVKNNNLISNINDSIELYNDEVILKIDGSTEYNSNIVSIMGRDILDIDKYPFEEGKDPSEGTGGTGEEGKDPSEGEGTGTEGKYPSEGTEGKDPSTEEKDPSESEGTGEEVKDPSKGTGEEGKDPTTEGEGKYPSEGEVKDPSKDTGEEGKDLSTTTEGNNSEIDKNNQSSSEETEKENVDTSTEIKDNENNKANTDSIVESSNNTTEEADNTITE